MIRNIAHPYVAAGTNISTHSVFVHVILVIINEEGIHIRRKQKYVISHFKIDVGPVFM